MRKPIIVYVSGAPGSGKTTLAKLLSDQLYVPHVSSDLVHGGVALTRPDHDRKETLLNTFVPLLTDMAQRGISFVVDNVLKKGQSEASIIDRLRPYANIVYIHTNTADPIQRYADRIQKSQLPSVVARREHLLSLAPAHAEKLAITRQPLDVDLPLLEVNTDNGYDPALDQIVAFIHAQYKA